MRECRLKEPDRNSVHAGHESPLHRTSDVTDTRAMSQEEAGLLARVATSDDLAAVTLTISRAFHEDPTWSWAFPDPGRRQEQYAMFWSFMIVGALRYPWVRMTQGGGGGRVGMDPPRRYRDRRRGRGGGRAVTQ